MENLKIKNLTEEQLIISIDRLTRFKKPAIKYLRVFKDIISQSLISPTIKKQKLEELDFEQIRKITEFIINSSLKNLGIENSNDYKINEKIYDYENSIFNVTDEFNILLNNKINYKGFTTLIKENSPHNLCWLKTLGTDNDIIVERQKLGFKFPIKTIILAEGITEEILLPEFAKLCDYDLNKNGIYVVSAGGKNQVVKYFYDYAESLKIPIFVLLDKDAQYNYEQIQPKLRAFDKVHLVNCGEFEDLLPLHLIEKTLDYAFKNISQIKPEDIKPDIPMAKNLEELFKNRGLHEFKKSEFAQMVKTQISNKNDISDEIRQIFEELKIMDNNNKKGTEVPL